MENGKATLSLLHTRFAGIVAIDGTKPAGPGTHGTQLETTEIFV